MPITASTQPWEPMCCSASCSMGMRLSAPSRPKRLVPGYLAWRYFSSPSAAVRRSRMATLAVSSSASDAWLDSSRWRTQSCSRSSVMYMYSAATAPQ